MLHDAHANRSSAPATVTVLKRGYCYIIHLISIEYNLLGIIINNVNLISNA